MSDQIISLKGVNKWFGEFHVLKDIDLSVNSKEKIVVCGPSGSGKSTLIRCINRLEAHQKGQIIVDNVEISEETKNLEERKNRFEEILSTYANDFSNINTIQ